LFLVSAPGFASSWAAVVVMGVCGISSSLKCVREEYVGALRVENLGVDVGT
jgi:hypothetical protein